MNRSHLEQRLIPENTWINDRIAIEPLEPRRLLSAATPFDSLPVTGGNLADATPLGIFTTRGHAAGSSRIGAATDHAVYEVSVLLPDTLTITVAKLKQAVHTQLLFSDGSPITTVQNGRKTTEKIVQRLDPGDYFIDISSGVQKTSPFKLTVAAAKPKRGSVAPQPPSGLTAPASLFSLTSPDFTLNNVNPTPTPQLADGFVPDPNDDLIYQGGRVIPDLKYANIYIGGDAWNSSDIQLIDQSLAAAMSDPNLQSVIAQYFAGSITTTFLGSAVVAGPAPQLVTQQDVENVLTILDQEGGFAGFDLPNTVFNFMLPPGTALAQGNANSLNGLGGFHGSVQVGNDTIYYAIGVYSQDFGGGLQNGLPVFDASWKDVVATFYHELNEARTDPDVEAANLTGNLALCGWLSPNGEEVGDSPIDVGQQLGQPLTAVFVEVPLTDGSGSVPIQMMWSNADHGPANPTPVGTVAPTLTQELIALELLALFL